MASTAGGAVPSGSLGELGLFSQIPLTGDPESVCVPDVTLLDTHVVFLRQLGTSGRLFVLAVNIVGSAMSCFGSQDTGALTPAMWPWENLFTDVGLSFPIRQMEIF